MAAQPVGQHSESRRYGPRTRRLITRARVSRDLLVGLVGVVFAVLGFTVPTPSYALSEPVGVFGSILAIVFVTAAGVRALSNDFDRNWSRGFRAGISVVCLLVGVYVMIFGATESGLIGAQGSGVTEACTPEGSVGVHVSSHAYVCHVTVHWPDGTTTAEVTNSPTFARNGVEVTFVRPPFRFWPFSGNVPLGGWPSALFDFTMGVLVTLQALFSLAVLTITGRRNTAAP